MKKSSGFTLIELLVVITILGILITALVPAVSGAIDRAKLAAASASASNVVKICNVIQVDTANGDTSVVAWPGSDSSGINKWFQSLTNYATTNDLLRYFSVDTVRATSWTTGSGPDKTGYYFYSVSDSSPSDSIMMTTKNWQPTAASGNGPALVASSATVPFGKIGFIVAKKSGSTLSMTPRQATNDIGSIGTYATNLPAN